MEKIKNKQRYTEFRRILRKEGTPAEGRLWTLIKDRQIEGFKFRRQYSIGRFVLDFYCVEKKLGIELDGSVHDEPGAVEYDYDRSQFLKKYGIKIIRFENKEVFEIPENVIEAIRQELLGSNT